MSVRAVTPQIGAGGSLKSGTFTDSSATPGNVVNNSARGRAAFAATGSSVVITNSSVTAQSTVLAIINQAAADATCTQIVRVSVGAGTFTVFGNAAATATTVFDFVVVN
jgi:hypothetical protein